MADHQTTDDAGFLPWEAKLFNAAIIACSTVFFLSVVLLAVGIAGFIVGILT